LPPPRLRACADYALELTQLQQGFATDGMGFRVKLRGSNFEPLMSALGHKRTFSGLCAMPALPPKADIDRWRREGADIHSAVGYY